MFIIVSRTFLIHTTPTTIKSCLMQNSKKVSVSIDFGLLIFISNSFILSINYFPLTKKSLNLSFLPYFKTKNTVFTRVIVKLGNQYSCMIF